MRFLSAFICLSSAASAAGCASFSSSPEEEFTITTQSVAPRSSMTWVGQPTTLEGEGDIRVGVTLPAAILVDAKMHPAPAQAKGRVRIIDTLPSLDTPVCDRQTHLLGESLALDPAVERVTISADLPYAQRRFAEEAKLTGITYLSDYRGGAFGRASGLMIARNGLLARAVLVVDDEGIVRHLQIVPEIMQLPDMEKAFAVANALVKKAH